MNRWILWGAGAGGVLLGGALAAGAVGAVVWSRSTARAVERLAGGAPDSPAAVFAPGELQGLPAPVARYFEWALTPGQPLVRTARIEHSGEFRTALDAPWSPFTSVQHFSAVPRGFVWDARIRMVPLLGVRVRDSYLNGRAEMLGRLGGVVPVVEEHGTPELASGALHRYLAEAAWLPTALLPSQGVTWEPIDDSTARATLSDSGVTVSLEVRFGEDGGIERVSGERFRDVDGVGVPTPWVGRFRSYARIQGMMIPMEGEVAWELPEGRLTYWRGRVDSAAYEFAR